MKRENRINRSPFNMQTKPEWSTRVEVDLSALSHNFRQVEQLVGQACKILTVVKADAYGHGALQISRELIAAGADMLGVATAAEGIRLRQAGVEVPILALLGLFDSHPEQLLHYNLTPVVYEISSANKLAKAAQAAGKTIKVHVKLDTGMGRLGFPWE